jgi:hypothetical protein
MRGYSHCARINSSIGVDRRWNRPFLKRGERPTPASAAAVVLHRRGDSVRAADDEVRGESLVRFTLGGRRASIAFLTDRLLAILEEMKAGGPATIFSPAARFPARRSKFSLHRARLPIVIPRLGGQRNVLPARTCRTRPAHVISDKAEQAYRRSDALARRRELMDTRAWHSKVQTATHP